MNWFAIFNLLALFCISFAPARAQFRIYRKIEGARTLLINEISEEYPNSFHSGTVYLYRKYDNESGKMFYRVGENSRRFSWHFLIDQRSTVVTLDNILIGYEEEVSKMGVTLTLKEDPFRFYQELFSFDVFNHEYPAARITIGTDNIGISAIKAKNGVGRELNFIALAGDTPCLIFPLYRVESIADKKAAKKVTFTLRQLLDHKTEITIEFDTSAQADQFSEFFKVVW